MGTAKMKLFSVHNFILLSYVEKCAGSFIGHPWDLLAEDYGRGGLPNEYISEHNFVTFLQAGAWPTNAFSDIHLQGIPPSKIRRRSSFHVGFNTDTGYLYNRSDYNAARRCSDSCQNDLSCDFYTLYNEDPTFYGSINPYLKWICLHIQADEYGRGYEMEAIEYDRHTNSHTGIKEHRAFTGIASADLCLVNPCLNDGKCENYGRKYSSTGRNYFCRCPTGYSGRHCEVPDVDCSVKGKCHSQRSECGGNISSSQEDGLLGCIALGEEPNLEFDNKNLTLVKRQNDHFYYETGFFIYFDEAYGKWMKGGDSSGLSEVDCESVPICW